MYILMLKRRLSLKSIKIMRVLDMSLFLAYNYIKQLHVHITGRISNPEGHFVAICYRIYRFVVHGW